MEKKQVKKVHSLSDILISAAILAFGILFNFTIPSWSWLVITLLVTAAVMLPFYRTGYRIGSQKGVFRKKEILLPQECREQIKDYIEGNAANLNINPFKKGGLLLEWYFTKDRSKQFGQLYDYEGNVFTPQSKLSELGEEQINTLLKYQS